MIRAEASPEGVALAADLAPGAVAFVDADWLPPGPADLVPALVASDGELRFGERVARVPPGCSTTEAATSAILAVAAEAAEAARAAGGAVEVVGRGLVAAAVRRLLADTLAEGDSARPAAIVETTGEPDAIVAATRRLADLGTLVLAGEPLDRVLTADLYPDVHVRGLEIVGVAPPPQQRDGAPAPPADDLLRLAEETIANVVTGEPLPPHATWYRLSG